MRQGRLVVVVVLSFSWAAGCGGDLVEEGGAQPLTASGGVQVDTLAGNTTLKFLPSGARFGAAPPAVVTAAASRTVSVFYPRAGQSPDGLCWQGLTSDAAGNIYPVGSGQISKLDSSGTIINGKNDQNFFATGGNSNWAVLDQPVRKLFSASGPAVRSAPFRAGARFSDLIGGIEGSGEAVAVGLGPLSGRLLVTDSGASNIYKVTLSPLAIKLFASGSLLGTPEAIASAPDGSIYVVNVGDRLDPQGRALLKISPSGAVKVFARTSDTEARRMVAVDSEGTVFWSSARGIDRFKPDGTRLSPLPGPPDQSAFGNPMGATFDSHDNLYVADNFGCKKIYKYTEH
jgi:hypothetical protein